MISIIGITLISSLSYASVQNNMNLRLIGEQSLKSINLSSKDIDYNGRWFLKDKTHTLIWQGGLTVTFTGTSNLSIDLEAGSDQHPVYYSYRLLENNSQKFKNTTNLTKINCTHDNTILSVQYQNRNKNPVDISNDFLQFNTDHAIEPTSTWIQVDSEPAIQEATYTFDEGIEKVQPQKFSSNELAKNHVLNFTISAKNIPSDACETVSLVNQNIPPVESCNVPGNIKTNINAKGDAKISWDKQQNAIAYKIYNQSGTSILQENNSTKFIDRSTEGKTPPFEYQIQTICQNKVSPKLSVKINGTSPIDTRFKRTSIDNTPNLNYQGLDKNKTYTLELVKSTEGMEGSLVLDKIKMDSSANLIQKKSANSTPIKIEVIGDSISAGYCDLRTRSSVKGCGSADGTFFEDGTLTYGPILSRAFGSNNWSIIAVSGIGVGPVSDTPKMIAEYPYQQMNWDEQYATIWNFTNKIEPDLIIVNLGTNDFDVGYGDDKPSPSSSAFVKKFKNYYKKLMQQVLTDNPNAHVIAFLPLQGTTAYYSQKWKNCWKAIENVVQNLNSSRVSVFPKDGYDPSDNWLPNEPDGFKYYGDQGTHPNVLGQKVIAKKLCEAYSSFKNSEGRTFYCNPDLIKTS